MEKIKIEVKDNQEQVDVCIVKYSTQTSGGIQSVQAGTYIEVDNTDPLNPIVNYTGSGGGGTLHSELTLDDGTNPHGTTKTDVGLGNVPNTDFTSAVAANSAKVSLDKAYTDTVNITAASGTVNIDFSLGIHFNITLTGNTTLTFSNYLPYKSIKVQTLQIKSTSAAHTLALPTGVTFTTEIDLSATPKNNFLSVNILGTDLFQCANIVKTIV